MHAQTEAHLQVMEILRLSDTRWVRRHVAVQLFKCRFKCLLDTLSTVVEKSGDSSKAAEAYGLQHQLENISFLLLFAVFEDILGLTKPLSDFLQTKQLDLASAMDFIDTTSKAPSQGRSSEYFGDRIWKSVTEMAQRNKIKNILQNSRMWRNQSSSELRVFDDTLTFCWRL